MIAALHRAVRVPGYEDHGNQSKQIGDHNRDANCGVGLPTKARLHNLWQPEAKGVGGKRESKTDTSQMPDSGVNKSPRHRKGMLLRAELLTIFPVQLIRDPSFFFHRQEP